MSSEVDLFDQWELQPEVLQEVTSHYGTLLEESERDGAELCREFLSAVEKLGYTFEYGLDCLPYDLRPVA